MQNSKFKLTTFNFELLTLNYNEGQAMITLLFFIVISILITTAAVIIITVNSISASKIEQADITLSIAESGMENAILRLLRNPNYTGETLTVGDGSAIISASGGTNKIATSEGRLNGFSRKIEAKIGYTNNVLTITSWKEIY